MTLIASMRCSDGLVIAADTEEVMSEPPLLRTRREKLRVLAEPVVGDWRVVVGGAGEYDYIGMIGDLLDEKLMNAGGPINEREIEKSIRSAVAEVWRDYARYEQRTIDIKMLIGSRGNSGGQFRLHVVSGAAVRRGSDVEAIGIGDATFKALADRLIQHGILSTVSASVSSVRAFMVYAFLQAKRSIPGIGGNTRIITMRDDGELQYMKSWAVGELQSFFDSIDTVIRAEIQHMEQIAAALPGSDSVERMLAVVGQTTIDSYKRLRKRLQEIEADDSLV